MEAACKRNKIMGLGNTEVERDLIGTKDCGACPQIAFPQKVY